MDIREIAKEYNNYLIEMRRWFHQHPEIAEKEFETSARVKEELTKYDISWQPCGLQTGVLATIVGAKPGKTILLLGGSVLGIYLLLLLITIGYSLFAQLITFITTLYSEFRLH